jgi:hypothetical protein
MMVLCLHHVGIVACAFYGEREHSSISGFEEV